MEPPSPGGSSDARQINVYLENPETTPYTARPRAQIDFIANKRLAVPDSYVLPCCSICLILFVLVFLVLPFLVCLTMSIFSMAE